jgi:hypothetical protein
MDECTEHSGLLGCSHRGDQQVVPAFLGAFGNLQKVTFSVSCSSVRPSVCPSVYPLGTTRLPLDGF